MTIYILKITRNVALIGANHSEAHAFCTQDGYKDRGDCTNLLDRAALY